MSAKEEFYKAMKGPLVGRTVDNWISSAGMQEVATIDGATYSLRHHNHELQNAVYDRYDYDEDDPDRAELIVIDGTGTIIAQWETRDDGAVVGFTN